MRDFVTDPNPTAVFHTAKELGTPEYVKTASVLTPVELTRLPDHAFADPVLRRLPVHSKAACWLSASYWYGNGGTSSQISAAIKQAAAAHEIGDEIDAIESLFAPVKEASAPVEPRHALTVDFEGAHGLQKQSFYPLDGESAIVDSSMQIDRDIVDGRLPREFAQVACRELVKAAREVGLPDSSLSPKIVAIGEDRLPNFDGLRYELGRRKSAGVQNLEDYEAVMDGAETEYRGAAFEERGTCLDKWASLWMDLDATNDISHGRDFHDPFSALYSGEKLASVDDMARTTVLIEDVMVPVCEVLLLPENQIKAAFSKETASIILDARKFTDPACDRGYGPGYGMSAKLASLDTEDRKELLRLLLEA